jgi:hypothetical protein
LAHSASAQPAWDVHDDSRGATDIAAPNNGASDNSASDSGSSGAVSSDDFADPTAGSAAGAAPAGGDPDAEFGEVREEELDEHLATLGKYLKDMQAPLRAYSGGWITLQAGLTGYFAWQASLEHGGPVRASNIMQATLCGVNMTLLSIAPMPGRSGWRKFKKMPEGTVEEKRAKLDAGRRFLSGQVAADKKATEPAQHVIAGLVALGYGAGLLFGWDDGLRPAVQTTLGVILIAELQFATRPHRTRKYNMEFAAEKRPAVEVSLAPLMTRTSRGIGLVGRF